jgi:hypothetical protein
MGRPARCGPSLRGQLRRGRSGPRLDPALGRAATPAIERSRLGADKLRPLASESAALFLIFFYFCVSDRIRSALGSIYVTDSQENSQHIAVDPRKKMMKETQDKIQTQNYYAEKIEDPRLLQIGRKDTRNTISD